MFSYSKVESVQFGREGSCACAADCFDPSEFFVMIRISLLEHRDPAFSSDRVYPAASLIIEDVITITDGG